MNVNLTISIPSRSVTFKFFISYNPSCKRRVGHGVFFLRKATDNHVVKLYENSCMKTLSVASLHKICGGFAWPNNVRKVPPGEAYQSVMSTIASIAPHDMKSGSSSNMRL